MINVLQMWKNRSMEIGNELSRIAGKDEQVMLNDFDAASKLLNLSDYRLHTKYKTYRSKMDLFFIAPQSVPLLVQENYLNAQMQAIAKRGNTSSKMD